jgi:DNA-binding SARP family transcriptional activator
MMIELNFLGTPHIMVNRHELVFRTRKALALLAYLALESGWHDRERLAGLLWPDSAQDQALSSLRKALSFLREAFETIGATSSFPLLVRRDAVAFDSAARYSLDVRLLDRAETEDLAGLEAASRAYRGAFLQDFSLADAPEFEAWAEAQREVIHSQVGWALGRLAERLARDGRLPEAEAAWRQRLRLDPLNEAQHQDLIQFLLESGNRAAALEVFRACKALLKTELGVEPSEQTLALAGRARAAPMKLESGEPELVGREREWALLEAAWQRGQTMLISGAPGVGKSRLAFEFAASKGSVFRLWGRPGDAAVPYSTHARVFGQVLALKPDLEMPDWVRLEMSRILPQLGLNPPPLTSDAEKLRFYEAKWVFYSLIAPDGWDVQVFDDVQFVDLPAAEAGIYIHSRLLPYQPGFPRTMFVFRADELEPWVEARLREWVTAGLAVWLDLEPLPEPSVANLLRGINDDHHLERFAPAMTKFTGGNPLLVLETVRAMLERGVPEDANVALRLPRSDRAQSITVGRLLRLGSIAQSLARLAAISGEAFNLELAVAALNLEPSDLMAALETLERASLMRGLRFTHDLIFEAVLEDIPASVRVALHGCVHDALLASAAPDAVLLIHAQGAGRWLAVFEHAVAAAAQSRDLYLFRDAVRFERMALKVVESDLAHPAEDQIFELHLRLIKTLETITQTFEARSLLEALLRRAQAADNLTYQSRALMMLGSNAATDGQFMRAFDLYTQALELAQLTDAPDLVAQIAAYFAVLIALYLPAANLTPKIEALIHLTEHSRHPGWINTAHLARAEIAAWDGDWDRVIRLAHGLRQTWQKLGERLGQITCLGLLARAGTMTARHELCDQVLEKALKLAESLDLLEFRDTGLLVTMVAWNLIDRDQTDQARALLTKRLEHPAAPSVPVQYGIASGILALLEYRQGNLEQARALNERALEFAEHAPWRASMLTLAVALSDDPTQAAGYALAALESRASPLLERLNSGPGIPRWVETQVLLQAEEINLAREGINRLFEVVGNNQRLQLTALRCQSVLAMHDQNHALHLEHLRRAFRIAQELGLPHEQRELEALLFSKVSESPFVYPFRSEP